MNDIEPVIDLPIAAQLAVLCFVVCVTGLLFILLTVPRRDCFFLRWTPLVRFLALVVSPALLIVWPIVLFGWFLKSLGIGLEDLDYFDED